MSMMDNFSSRTRRLKGLGWKFSTYNAELAVEAWERRLKALLSSHPITEEAHSAGWDRVRVGLERMLSQVQK